MEATDESDGARDRPIIAEVAENGDHNTGDTHLGAARTCGAATCACAAARRRDADNASREYEYLSMRAMSGGRMGVEEAPAARKIFLARKASLIIIRDYRFLTPR